MKKIPKGAGVLLIAAAMIFSAIAVTADTQEQALSTSCSIGSGAAPGALGPVVYSNGMDYGGLSAAQYEAGFDTYQADDFILNEATEVGDVHWVGGYWNTDYQTGDFDWCISFYYDNGTGEEPMGHPKNPSFAGPYCFTWEEIVKEVLEDTGQSLYYKLSVNLPEVLVFDADVKYWISIWGDMTDFPPQSGWGYHQSFLFAPAVWGSDYFGFPFWTPGVDVLGVDFDNCFELTAPTPPTPPTDPRIDGPSEGVPEEELCWTFHSSDENGDMVMYTIDFGDDSAPVETDLVAQCEPFEVCHTYAAKGTYIIKAKATDATGLESGETTFEVKIPRARTVYHPIILKLLERFPNVFPIFRQLLNL
jgi:hypothetical protein